MNIPFEFCWFSRQTLTVPGAKTFTVVATESVHAQSVELPLQLDIGAETESTAEGVKVLTQSIEDVRQKWTHDHL